MSRESDGLQLAQSLLLHKTATQRLFHLSAKAEAMVKAIDQVSVALKNALKGAGIVALPSDYPDREAAAKMLEDIAHARGKLKSLEDNLDGRGYRLI